jgi:hypothetical protein
MSRQPQFSTPSTRRPPAGGLRNLILVCAALAAANTAAAAERIENEYKLSVPVEKTDEVWNHLKARYSGADSFLHKHDAGFEVKFSEEFFEDRYFDTPELTLYQRKGGIRHRTRRIPDNPDHPKHGRRLVQIKLSRPDDPNPLNRTEIKFDTADNPKPGASVVELVQKSERVDFVKAVTEHGIGPRDLKETIKLNQRRRRIYIAYQGEAFATVTLDEVSSRRLFTKYRDTEVEIELNEIGYTEGDEATRRMMQEVSDLIKNELSRTFSYIEQNQTPKYNKALSYFKENVSFFDRLIAFF